MSQHFKKADTFGETFSSASHNGINQIALTVTWWPSCHLVSAMVCGELGSKRSQLRSILWHKCRTFFTSYPIGENYDGVVNLNRNSPKQKMNHLEGSPYSPLTGTCWIQQQDWELVHFQQRPLSILGLQLPVCKFWHCKFTFLCWRNCNHKNTINKMMLHFFQGVFLFYFFYQVDVTWPHVFCYSSLFPFVKTTSRYLNSNAIKTTSCQTRFNLALIQNRQT